MSHWTLQSQGRLGSASDERLELVEILAGIPSGVRHGRIYRRTASLAHTDTSLVAEDAMIKSLADIEKEVILEAILATGSVADAAKALKIAQSTIYEKMKKYGLRLKANEIIRELKRQQSLPIPISGSTSNK